MNRLNWYVTRFWEQLPLLGLLGWGSLLTVVWLVITLLIPMHQQLLEVQSSKPVMETVEPEQNQQHSGNTDFISSAPRVDAVSDAINTLFLLAGKHRLNLDEVSYQDEPRPGEPILPYTIDFNVKASYPAAKSFLTELLVALPYLALQQIRFEREAINDDAADIHLKLSLYLHHE